jgi:lipopolysaccharide transport system permease protein
MSESILPPVIRRKSIHLWGFLNPIEMINGLWKHRDLIRQFTIREINGRYKSSYLGLIWTFLNPLLMLGILTFVFSVVLKAKWGVDRLESEAEFALTLFCGMIGFNLFSECLNRAPGLIVNSPNFVKKVVFPLEIMPVYILLSSLIHCLISMGILILGILAFSKSISWTILYLPLVLFPLLFYSLGLSWFFASMGVFIRDINNVVGFMTTALFFMTPIFYPITALPESFQIAVRLNPLTMIVEDLRRIMVWGRNPDWAWYSLLVFLSVAILLFGYAWFMKSKRTFADVL